MHIGRRAFLLRGLAPVVSATLLTPALSGCGSILYPERVGQPRNGPLDWKVVALDGLGLLLFFIPGVVAFAVDFYNGTIFLPTYAPPSPLWESQPDPQPQEFYLPPPPDTPQAAAGLWDAAQFETIDVPPDELTRIEIERLVSQRIGRPVRLDDDDAKVAALDDLDSFGARARELAAGEIKPLPLDRAFQPRATPRDRFSRDA
ncbi:MAG: hypothetical protein RIC55_30310 [Pirellulaceae bacterium]